ncbi:galactose mutarotase [Paracoccus liaowanqingii]|uniref:Aldose 1-epimerase n=1 Tax=Paracoccus liaowanqingii TaxID=2560053 RepID=A0A4Z1CQ68_9RHOB|nr:aldose epimerase family protein [Paracoccus liaowanqingii]TGN67163.1 galactose mutarotase [Paracoccus liaowanqingii]
MSIASAGTLPDGREVQRITLRDGRLTAHVLTLGAIVQDLRLDGVDHPLVLGCPDIADYLDRGKYFGAIVGRCANRIAGGRFRLDGQDHQVDLNFRGRHCLHGGSQGTDLLLWQVVELTPGSVILRLMMEDGHMGFPGRMRITARITLRDDTLRFDLTASADRATPCNMTHHGYFALDGQGGVAGQTLRIDADHYLPVDDDLIPTGAIVPVEGTAFDFRTPRPLQPGSYDHNLCLSDGPQPLREVAQVTGREGLSMRILTTACGLQIYDGVHLQDVPGLDGQLYGRHAGLALEAQFWPDAVNRSDFPDTVLRPGTTWSQTIAYRFAN